MTYLRCPSRITLVLLLLVECRGQLDVSYDRKTFVEAPTGRHTHISSYYTVEDLIHNLLPTGVWVQLPRDDPTACIQIITSSTAQSRTDCSLPTYCSDVVYQQLENGWFHKVGVCVGSRRPLMKVTISDGATVKTKIIAHDWCQVHKLQPLSGATLSEFNTNIDVYVCDQEIPELPPAYFFASADFTKTLIRYKDALEMPTMATSTDGRYCMPYWRGNKQHPYLNGPYNAQQLYANVTWFMVLERPYTGVLPQVSLNPTQYVKFEYPIIYVVKQTDFEAVRCDYYLATMNTLPFGLSTIFGTITHVLETILAWVLHRVWYFIRPAVRLLHDLHVFTPWVFTAAIYVAYTRGNLYAICAAVVVVPIIHGLIISLLNQ